MGNILNYISSYIYTKPQSIPENTSQIVPYIIPYIEPLLLPDEYFTNNKFYINHTDSFESYKLFMDSLYDDIYKNKNKNKINLI